MKKLLAFALSALLLLSTGCAARKPGGETENPTPGNNGAGETQYVLALNPAVSLADGSVDSLRNTLASAMSADHSAETTTEFSDNSPWHWSWHGEDGSWNNRLIRELSVWTDGSGARPQGASYAYKFSDTGTSSLSLFDASRMEIDGFAQGDLPGSGVLFSFSGTQEEGICYVAPSDSLADYSDIDGGKVALVSTFGGLSANAFPDAEKAIVLRAYKNNRIYWQEVLDASTTAVDFPSFRDLGLSAGDSLIFTAQAVADASDIERGNCDLPATSALVTTRKPIYTQQLVQKDPTPETPSATIPLLENGMANFTMVRAASASSDDLLTLSDFRSAVMDALNVEDLDYHDDSMSDPDTLELHINTSACAGLISELKAKRANNVADFIIRLQGNKILLAAVDPIGLQNGLDFFRTNYCKGDAAAIDRNLNYISANFNPTKNLTLAGTPIRDYVIVLPATAAYIESKAADYLVAQLATLTGYRLPVVRDYTKQAAHEIVLGTTHRTSADYDKNPTTAETVSFDYSISVASNRTSVSSGHGAGVNAGAIALVSTLKSKGSLANGFSASGKYDGEYSLTEGYKLTFADDFNGDKLSDYWRTESLDDARENEFGGTEYNLTGASQVHDGALVQHSYKEGNTTYRGSIFSNGKHQMRFQWGYVEARVRFSSTPGVSCAFWTQSSTVGGFLESDIWENYGDPWSYHPNLHLWADTHLNLMGGAKTVKSKANGEEGTEPLSDRYHTIGWEWTDDTTKFYCDGEVTHTYDHSASTFDCFDKPAWLIVVTGPTTPDYGSFGLDGTGSIGDQNFPGGWPGGYVWWDYIHLYQKDDGSILYIKP